MEQKSPVGRFAPTPSGRMHLGNVFAGLIAWLSVKSRGGHMVLRMEDLDTQRTSTEFAELVRQDLLWLGLSWDAEQVPQSENTASYDRVFQELDSRGLLYPCYCTRSQLHSPNAPHMSDGTYVYPGTCRNLTAAPPKARLPAWRLRTEDADISLTDLLQGEYTQNLASECGDFVVRRADGVYVYQLAVVTDDAAAGVTEVVRGVDLLGSAPRQIFLQQLLDYPRPQYGHVPLLLAPDGRRLSKRDRDLDLGQLQKSMTAEQIIGSLAFTGGLLKKNEPISARELACHFSWEKLKKDSIFLDGSLFCP